MSKNLSLKVRHLLAAIFLLLGMDGAPPCYAMWGQEHDLAWLNREDLRPCTRGHYGGYRLYCSRCVDADAKEKAKKKERIEKVAARETEESRKPSY